MSKIRASYIGVRGPDQMLAALEQAVKAGVPEIHLGFEHCAFCGGSIGSQVEKMGIGGNSATNPIVYLHLCRPCWTRYRDAGHTKEVGRG